MPNLMVGNNQVHYEQVGEGQDLVLLPTLLAEMTVYDEVIDERGNGNSSHRIPAEFSGK